MLTLDHLLRELDAEMAATRRMLSRVPEEHAEWRPHEKSMPLGSLARHVAQLPGWAVSVFRSDSLDLAAGGPASEGRPDPRDQAALLELFDRTSQAAREALAAAEAGRMDDPWTLKAGEQEIFTLPRGEVYRRMVLNHIVHHRAQLGVYLRLLDIPLPRVYGPTADER
jgi:uncharacterized damage-inducible protein DinB